jgi:hypothetical protein
LFQKLGAGHNVSEFQGAVKNTKVASPIVDRMNNLLKVILKKKNKVFYEIIFFSA